LQELVLLRLLLLSFADAARAHAKPRFCCCSHCCGRRRRERRSLHGPPTHACGATAALFICGACDAQRHRDGPKSTGGVAFAYGDARSDASPAGISEVGINGTDAAAAAALPFSSIAAFSSRWYASHVTDHAARVTQCGCRIGRASFCAESDTPHLKTWPFLHAATSADVLFRQNWERAAKGPSRRGRRTCVSMVHRYKEGGKGGSGMEGTSARRRLTCSGFCPQSRRSKTPSENPTKDAERHNGGRTQSPGSQRSRPITVVKSTSAFACFRTSRLSANRPGALSRLVFSRKGAKIICSPGWMHLHS